jgi:stage IV sporulation protein B
MLPNNIILMQGEALNLNTILGINVKSSSLSNAITASSNLNNSIAENTGKMELELDLFNLFPVKDVTVNVIPKTKVVPLGKTIGMRLYTEGVLVVGMSEIEGKKPYENSGIETGDKIVEVNNVEIKSTDELIQCVNSANGSSVEVKYINNKNEEEVANITPAKTAENEYKLGLWVRDAAAGVGTVTFYEPQTGEFGALGHGINDVDTYELIDIANGEIVTTNIIDIVKGEKGSPGEIRGIIEGERTIGNVSKNTSFGVYGNMLDTTSLNINKESELEVANRSEIKLGKAEIMCELENGKVEKYEIEIQKIFLDNNSDNKSMLIKVTDEELIEKTGGIIQGMSGAPVIQNGKFIGAVTHVLVNDPQMGYAIFGDLMIKQMREVN